MPDIPAASPTTPTSQPAVTSQPGGIVGTVVDKDGAVLANATITLSQEGKNPKETHSGSDGQFTFTDVAPGPFKLGVIAAGFETQEKSASLTPGQIYTLPPIQLVVGATVEVEVKETQEEIAEEQIHVEEKQRILGVIPNYYVSYDPAAVPLNRRQKFQLAWKSSLDPVNFGISAFIAGIEQADNAFSGYGPGAQGYSKRFGATYADFASGTFIGGAILPALLKQDPRYFYKGTGSRKSRFWYAMANAVICKGDNGHWQPNYSSILGSLAAGGLSNLYYPASNRQGVGLTFENTAIGIAGTAFGAVIQEFFLKRMTPHASDPR